MKKTILSIALSIFMLVLFMFFSCGDSNDAEKGGETEIANEQSGMADDDMPQKKEDEVLNLPDIDYGGHVFTVLARGENWGDWQNIDLVAETINGETINDAVFQRNTILEDKYGFFIEEQKNIDVLGAARKSIGAGDEAFDAVIPLMADGVSLANSNLLYNFNDFQYLDLDKSWWDQSVRSSFGILGKLYMMTGSISVNYDDATWVMMFNKKLHNDYGLEDIYEIVKSGKWTIDKFYSLTRGIYKDLDENSQKSNDDFYGFTTHENSVDGFFFGSGLNIVGKDSAGAPSLVMNSQKTVAVLEKTVEVLHTSRDTYCLPGDNWADIQRIFEDDRALFFGEVLQCVVRLRQMNTDFGVVPFPKWDESQKDYISFVAPAAGMYCVPKTALDPDRTGFILEAMAYWSKVYLDPAYFDKVLTGKQFRDEESSDMLEIIKANRVFDLGYLFDWGKLSSGYRKLAMNSSVDFASMYEQNSAVAQSEIDKLIEAYKLGDN